MSLFAKVSKNLVLNSKNSLKIVGFVVDSVCFTALCSISQQMCVKMPTTSKKRNSSFQNKEEIMLNVVIVTYDVTHIFFSLNLFASKFGNPNTGRAGLHSAF